MNKYLYKGQIVTASSKEEAIKVLATRRDVSNKRLTTKDIPNEGNKTSYPTVSIGGKQWMSENLAYDDGEEGITYNPDNKEYYYTWDAAKRVAKKLGWKLPSAEDWNKAAEECGAECVNPEEKDTGWRDYKGGNLKEKLKLKLVGRYSNGFYSVGSCAYFWTSTESSSTNAYCRFFRTGSSMDSSNFNKSSGYSVRLVK